MSVRETVLVGSVVALESAMDGVLSFRILGTLRESIWGQHAQL